MFGGLYDVTFADLQHGWVVGERCDSTPNWRVVLRTTDGGQTWTEQILGSDGFPCMVYFLNAEEGWISDSPDLLHTTDGGDTWIHIPTTRLFKKIQFVDSLHGWAATDLAYLCHTTDGGRTWTPQAPNPVINRVILSLYCLDDNTVWAVGEGGLIYRTEDSGSHWTTWQAADSNVRINAVHFADAQRGWAVGWDGMILHTSDGGLNWSLQNGNMATASARMSCAAFADSHHGWAASWDAIMHTSDGGQSWMIQDSVHGANSLVAIDSLTAWMAGGNDCALRHTTNSGAEWITVTPGGNICAGYVAASGRDHLWVLGAGLSGDSCICRSTDAGGSWACFPLTEYNSNDLWSELCFADDTHGWRYGGGSEGPDGFILHTGDGGATWAVQSDNPGSFISDISCVDSQHAWACGEYGVLLKTTDGGEHWSELPDSGLRLSTVQFLDSLHGWGRTRNGLSVRSTDGGNTWDSICTGTGNSIDGMCFSDFEHGWLVGPGGAILHYDGTASAAPRAASILARTFALSAYPNPFNPTTVLSFDVPTSGRVRLVVYDITGRLVTTLTDQVCTQGNYRVSFDGADLPSGIYFARMSGKGFSKTQKLVLLK